MRGGEKKGMYCHVGVPTYGITITAVQEIRWSGSEIFDSGDFIVCYSGNKERRQF
jgi:hypothetical protein